jgi:putative intracellular protease/amidase
MNPDTLRINDQAMAIVKGFLEGGKVVAALLVGADAVNGRQVTSYKSIRTDVMANPRLAGLARFGVSSRLKDLSRTFGWH